MVSLNSAVTLNSNQTPIVIAELENAVRKSYDAKLSLKMYLFGGR